MKTKNTNKCQQCGKVTTHKTFFIVLDANGLVATTKCVLPSDTILSTERNEAKAREIARLTASKL